MANGMILEPAPIVGATSSSTAIGYRASNVGSDAIGLVWRSAPGSTTQSLILDLGADTPLNTITLHGLAGAQPGWVWSIELASEAQGRFTGAYWSGAAEGLLAGSAMPVSKKGRAIWRAPSDAPLTARYVRLLFAQIGGAAVEVARVVIAAKIQLERNFRYGAAFGIRPLGSLDFSARGVILRRRGRKLRGLGVTYEAATREEVEGAIMPLLERVGNDSPIVIVVDPDSDAQRQNRIYYGFLTGDLGTIWARPGGFTASFNLVALD